MAENTSIEWADHTFNPWVGCMKVSPGCDHCYAESWAKRAGKNAGVTWGGERRRTSAANWKQPLQWNAQAQREGRRMRVFCASLADVFDNDVPPVWRADLFELIDATPNLDWLLLTKRIGNVKAMLEEVSTTLALRETGAPWPPRPNVWLGATVVNQAEADRDIPKLLAVPARVRFLSIEPMLGPIDLRRIGRYTNPNRNIDALRGIYTQGILAMSPAEGSSMVSSDIGGPRLNWVICGGESGPGARPMHPDWARSLRDQCAAAGVPFLFKQWGEHAPNWLNDDAGHKIPGSEWIDRLGKKAAGRVLDGRTHDGFPEAQ